MYNVVHSHAFEEGREASADCCLPCAYLVHEGQHVHDVYEDQRFYSSRVVKRV